MVVKQMNRLKKKEEAPPAEPTTKSCPKCLMEIPIKATRCGHCTSEVSAA
jgi:large conductance mechanosensitive channel